jgi:hypothetical protein
MEERPMPRAGAAGAPAELPAVPRHEPPAEPLAAPRAEPLAAPRAEPSADPRARAVAEAMADSRSLTILTTEHWSLLSARSLVYNEAFARSGMFLTFVSGTFVALGLASTATGFSHEFLAVTAIALGLDLFIGLATMGRAMGASREDIRYLAGMNRIRHAYHEMVPGLERYFITSHHDDARGVLGGYGQGRLVSVAGLAHGLTTTIGMLLVINAAIAAVLAGVVALLAGAAPWATVVLGMLVLAVAMVGELAFMARSIRRTAGSLEAAFPSPAGSDSDRRGPGG